MLDEETKKSILIAQGNEITEYHVYEKLSRSSKDPNNKEALKNISEVELRHHDFWQKITQENAKPNIIKIWWYSLISSIFGITFGLKLLKRGEDKAQVTYAKVSSSLPEVKDIIRDENEHEVQLLKIIDEERLRYVGSIVLGLNDALVEITGSLAGLTLALQSTRLIAMVGLITGISASLSMSTSEYLSTKSEESEKNPLRASIYTGGSYVLTVVLLVLPYLLIDDIYFCLVFDVLSAIIIILIFTYYVSVTRDLPFRSRFLEMTIISLGIAALSFGIGFLVKTFFKVEI